jgi:hypothetical protein
MPRETEAEGWTWIPARGPAHRRGQAIGGLVLAIACVSIGVVIGRISSTSDREVTTAEHRPQAVQVPIAPASPRPAPAASPNLSLAIGPERSTIQDARPSLALGNEPQDSQREANVAPAPADAPALLNPGTASSPKTVQRDEGSIRWKRALAKRTRHGHSVDRPRSPSPNRDYQALRDYVLSR